MITDKANSDSEMAEIIDKNERRYISKKLFNMKMKQFNIKSTDNLNW